jgi:hypothetical protein
MHSTMNHIPKLNYRYLYLSPRRILTRLLTIGLLCFAFSLLMDSRTSPDHNATSLKKALHLSKRGTMLTEGHPVKHGDWCTEAEYLDGEWLQREEEVTLDRLREIYQYTVSTTLSSPSRL